jgi:hypothetical protein
MDVLKKVKLEKLLKYLTIFAITCCCVLLFPQVRKAIIGVAENCLGRELKDHGKWMGIQLKFSLFAIFYFAIFLTYLYRKKLPVRKIFIFAAIGIGVTAFVIMIRVLWLDEANILKTTGTFFLFFISFSLTLILVLQKIKDWRSSFMVSFLYFGVFAWFLTEMLSFFKILTLSGILCGWIVYNVILLTFFFYLYKSGKVQIKTPQVFCSNGGDIYGYGFLAVILFVTFFIAVVYPPNNWDSMTYHLPRIEHWLQNKSLNHYYTSIDRQLLSAPFAEILILQGRALSGDDYLANLVQWFSFLGSIIGISKIAGRLGMNRKMQIVSALFFATVPMAILQASSTQTDLVTTFF